MYSDRRDRKVLIHCWCGPRTCSTSLMYSFSQRSDTACVDEPLYAAYLKQSPHIHRPYLEKLFQSQKSDASEALNDIYRQFQLKPNVKIVFAKHMARHMDVLDDLVLLQEQIEWENELYDVKHVFLIRDPIAMISSWNAKLSVHEEKCSLETMCILHMVKLFSELRGRGQSPVVLDSNILVKESHEVINEVSIQLNIPFMEAQLSWPAGPKECDGIWAEYWYDRVHQSTGFNTFCAANCNDAIEDKVDKYPTFNGEQLRIYREALPFFDLLQRNAVGVDALSPGSIGAPLYFPNAIDRSRGNYSSSIQQLADVRNRDVIAWVGDRLLPRELAKISAFDSAVQGGDAVWEGIRIYDGRVFMFEDHLQRLFDSAKALAFQNIPSRQFVMDAVFRTLAANGMRNGAHIRLTLTRGAKLTSSMNPVFNIFGCNLIVLAEWKPVGDPATYNNAVGIKLITAAGRRNSPQCVDSKIHHCNLINNILPKIQANLANAADALMLDPEGFVSETNATNVFMVKDGIVKTPHADYCLPGVTRKTVMDIVRFNLQLPIEERRISLAEFHAADEVFTTGTMGEITPVVMIDGRSIGEVGIPGIITSLIQAEYRKLTETMGTPLPF